MSSSGATCLGAHFINPTVRLADFCHGLLGRPFGLPYVATQRRRSLCQPLPEGDGQIPRDVYVKHVFLRPVDSMNQDVHVMDGTLCEGVCRECFGIQVYGQATIQQQRRPGTGYPQDSPAVPEISDDRVCAN